MTSSTHSILFVSGAGLPAWIWDDVRRELGDAYLTQVAPRPRGDMPGPKEYAAAALADVSAKTFSIVAHSAGGLVASEICRLAPERVNGLLAISATVSHPGGSFLSAMSAPNRWILGLIMRLAGTRPPESAIRNSLAHGIEASVVDRLVADFTPEPQSYYRGRTSERPIGGRRAYLVTTADKEMPTALQRSFAARLGAPEVRELATGHLPMLEDPVGVAREVMAFVAESAAGPERQLARKPSTL